MRWFRLRVPLGDSRRIGALRDRRRTPRQGRDARAHILACYNCKRRLPV
jgi:hypothetical protein